METLSSSPFTNPSGPGSYPLRCSERFFSTQRFSNIQVCRAHNLGNNIIWAYRRQEVDRILEPLLPLHFLDNFWILRDL